MRSAPGSWSLDQGPEGPWSHQKKNSRNLRQSKVKFTLKMGEKIGSRMSGYPKGLKTSTFIGICGYGGSHSRKRLCIINSGRLGYATTPPSLQKGSFWPWMVRPVLFIFHRLWGGCSSTRHQQSVTSHSVKVLEPEFVFFITI